MDFSASAYPASPQTFPLQRVAVGMLCVRRFVKRAGRKGATASEVCPFHFPVRVFQLS